MKSPWIIYTLTRLGLFFGVFLVLALIGFNPLFLRNYCSCGLFLYLTDFFGQAKKSNE